MGNNRTRGFGEIVCNIIDIQEEKEEKQEYQFEPEKEYEIKLILKAESNIMVSKQFSEITENYIPGSNIMGAVASKYIKEKNIKRVLPFSIEFRYKFIDT